MRYLKEDFDVKCRKVLHMVLGKTKEYREKPNARTGIESKREEISLGMSSECQRINVQSSGGEKRH